MGNRWKLEVKISMCMFNVPKEIQAFCGELQYVDTCPNSPLIGMAFCQEHCEIMQARNIPIKLREFLQFKSEFKVDDSGKLKMTAADCQGK